MRHGPMLGVLCVAIASSGLAAPDEGADREAAPIVEPGSTAVVMPLQVSGIAPETVSTLDELLAEAVRRIGELDVMGRSDIDAMLGLDKLKDRLGCDDVSCAAELGGALGVQYLIAGRTATLGDSLVILLKLIDTRQLRVLSSIKHKAPNDESLYDRAIEEATMALFGAREARATTETTSTETVGILRIEANAPRAIVYLDGKRVGTSPITLASVDARVEHEVSMEAEGYFPAARTVRLTAGETTVVDFALDPERSWFVSAEAGSIRAITAADADPNGLGVSFGATGGHRFHGGLEVGAALRAGRTDLLVETVDSAVVWLMVGPSIGWRTAGNLRFGLRLTGLIGLTGDDTSGGPDEEAIKTLLHGSPTGSGPELTLAVEPSADLEYVWADRLATGIRLAMPLSRAAGLKYLGLAAAAYVEIPTVGP